MEYEIKDLKDNDRLLLDKVMKHETQLARVEEHQHHTDDLIEQNQEIISNNIETMCASIVENIHNSVDGRLTDAKIVMDGQQKTLNKIIEVQGRQTQQIEGIQKTLEQFTKIELRVNDHETRINTLEKQYQSEEDLRKALRKEHTKGLWALLGAAVAAAGAILAAIIPALIR